MAELSIRRARVEDAAAISALIKGVARYFTIHPDGRGAERFLSTIGPAGIEAHVANPAMNYWAGFIGSELAGVVAIRDNKHLFHLFVSPEFQGRGLARELWDFARGEAVKAGNAGGFTVNSTPFAKPVYEKFGFAPTGPLVQADGIEFLPMSLKARS